MRFFLGMAIQALVRGVLEVGARTGIMMAFCARQIQVDSGELEFSLGMVEFFTDRFDPIMAGKAVITVRERMSFGKYQIFLFVAIETGLVVEGGIISRMTIGTYGIFMGGQGKSQSIMGDIRG